MKHIRTFSTCFILLILTLNSQGCIFSPQPPEDSSFLKPIPEATLQAFEYGQPIKTRLLAVIAAQREMQANAIKDPLSSLVVSVEQMKYGTALARVERNINQVIQAHPDNMNVWLVVFLTENTSPTNESARSAEISQICTFVIIDELDGHALLLGNSSDCKSLYVW